MKPRVNIYLDDHVAAQLTLLAKRPGLNKSRIVNDALGKLFNPERDERFEKGVLRRLDQVSKLMTSMKRNESITSETLALFVRYFLTITPPLPQSEQAAAHALGLERFEVFIAKVGRRLAQDQNLITEVLEHVIENRPDLFAQGSEGSFEPTPSTSVNGKTAIKPMEPQPLQQVINPDDEIEDVNDIEDAIEDEREAGHA